MCAAMPSVSEQLSLIKRGCVDLITEDELVKKLQRGTPLRIKAGFDPTAPDLHLGHTVLLEKLRQFQELGHQVIFLIGDFTARIGDPSGRSETRPPLTTAEIQHNVQTYTAQAFHVLDRTKTTIAYNSQWLGNMTAVEMIQLAAQHNVARMLERDDFKQRFKNQQSIGLHEFLYPLLQGQDSVELRADVELGGADQIFNLLVGRMLQERARQEPQVVLTMPLLVGTDGEKKMSKSYGNHIAIQDSPQEMFGKILSISDESMWAYYPLLSHLPVEAIERRKTEHPKAAKVALAKELVARYHSNDAAEQAAEEFERVFARKERPTDAKTIEAPANTLVEVLHHCGGVASSKGGIRRLIEQGGVRVNDEVIDDMYRKLEPGEYWIRAGKRWQNKVVIR